MFYLDTSFIVSALRADAHSAAAQGWLEVNKGTELWMSDWAMVEFSSVVSLLIRKRVLSPIAGDALFQAFMKTRRDGIFRITDAPASEDYVFAAEAIRHYETGLRGGDALHIALARKLSQAYGDTTLVTFDKGLAKAAPVFGVAAIQPNI